MVIIMSAFVTSLVVGTCIFLIVKAIYKLCKLGWADWVIGLIATMVCFIILLLFYLISDKPPVKNNVIVDKFPDISDESNK